MLKIALIAASLATASLAFAQAPAAPAAPVPAKAVVAAPAAPVASGAMTGGAEPAVKKSKNDICHDKGSNGYKQTKNFTPFNSMDECVKSGGRPPKGDKK